MQNQSRFDTLHSIARVFFSSVLFCFSISCEKKEKHQEGKKLAKIHCASCHMHTAPSVLPRRVWGEKIIPNMGLKMGMAHGPLFEYGDPETSAGLNPMMSQEDWDMIVHFYLNESENSIPKNTIQNQEPSNLFEPYIFSLDSLSVVSMTTYDKKNGNLFLGNATSFELLTITNDGAVHQSEKLESPPVKVAFKDALQYALTIGNLNPSDEAEGKLRIGENVITGLTRPVDFLIHDVNLDGYDDVFVCNYGNNSGDFSLFENLKDGTYSKRVIHPLSGAIKVEIANMDADPEDEIVVLFAQEHELIMIWDFESDSFAGKKVVQFQPAFGSVDFQLRDMNGDGLTDIIIGNGDNSDLSTVLKNFHGVRVLTNKGNKEFSEDHFWPMHGVSKIVAEDFDLDGDTDILAVSNFGDFTNPKFKSVQFLSNEGALKFSPKFVQGLPEYRWQTVDVSDYDKDGDFDVFLGAFNLNIGPKESNIAGRKPISWVKLENKIN